jgi:uncharacterized protein involved in response to NO
MRHFGIPVTSAVRRPVPRGIAQSGPALLSYGFRPFFLLAGIAGCLNMIVWIGALSGFWEIGGREGPIAWHGHEMLFGYATAALCGFILTAVPNWTGRLPVSGNALLALVLLWCAGRILLAIPTMAGSTLGAVVDSLFLPTLALIVTREVVAGRNWRNLRIAAGITSLAALNIVYHLAVALGLDVSPILRGALSLYVILIVAIGGRIIPSFTRNYLVKRGGARLPQPLGPTDHVAVAATLVAGVAWAVVQHGPLTAGLCIIAAGANAVRLARWRGTSTLAEPLVLVLHIAYGFVCVGFVAFAAAALSFIALPSALHVMTVGAIGLSTLAVMTRASRGHTGRPPTASWITTTCYVCLICAAILRPFADLLSSLYHPLLEASGIAWILAFILYLIEHGPMLVGPSHWAR